MQENPLTVNEAQPNHNGHHSQSEQLQQLGTAAKETLDTAIQNTKRQNKRKRRRRSFRGRRRRASNRQFIRDKNRITAMTEAGIAAVERWAGAGTLPDEQKEVLVHMGAALNAAVYSAKTMDETINHIHLALRAAYFYGVAQPQRLPIHPKGNGKNGIQEDPVAE